MNNLSVLKFYVAKFDQSLDDYKQITDSLSIESCRLFLSNVRKKYPHSEYVIIAVLDE